MRPPNSSRWQYDMGVLKALEAIVMRMNEGETLDEALTEDLDSNAHNEMKPIVREGFIDVFYQLQEMKQAWLQALKGR